MKILVVAPLDPQAFGHGVVKAFKKMGHETLVFDYRAWMPRTTRWRQALNRLLGVNQMRKMNHGLADTVRKNQPDLVFVIKGEYILAETVLEIKKSGARTAVWHLDNPHNILCSTPWLVQGLAVYDFVFLFDPYYIAGVQALGARRVFYLPLCFDDSFLPVDQKIQDNVCFVGNPSDRYYNSPRQALLSAVSNVGLALYGRGWEKYPDLKDLARGPAFGRNLLQAYAAAKIGLNVLYEQSVEGLNIRGFEIPGSGTFMMTNDVKMLGIHFRLGEECVVFQDAEDLRRKAVYYLEHEEERRAIARRGHERALRDHTCLIRMKEMLDIVQC